MKKQSRIDPAPLFRYLDARGIQYVWLAKQLGVTAGYLTNIKAGRDKVPMGFPEQVSKILAIPAWMLFDGLPEPVEGETAERSA